ncbi:MAG: TIGR04283 family arsenosugar biosynthesis glycosyltransferase [Acidobacteriota bacterium]|nr:MAG: TIGR04283 family arsenosugar biosynthesis glycosyltransferase [Acidobacteriota bacterium]
MSGEVVENHLGYDRDHGKLGAVPVRVTTIIPVLNEQQRIDRVLDLLSCSETPLEIIVCDGGSQDDTFERARRRAGVRAMRTPRGRATQMNAGAREARGEVLWFLHADCEPSADAARAITDALTRPDRSWGAFRFALHGSRRSFRLIERLVAWRTRWRQLPYGDQGLFVRRETFEQLGGFRAVPVFEDVYLVRALRRISPPVLLDQPLPSSPRRWEREGLLCTFFRHQWMLLLDALGASPERLARVRETAARESSSSEGARTAPH